MVSHGILVEVLRMERSASRFERYANAVISKLEGGATVVSTGASWDLGRDGRQLRGREVFVCSSLRDDLEPKVLGDIERLLKSAPSAKRVYFCFTHELSEYRNEQIKANIRQQMSKTLEVEILDVRQIAEVDLHGSEFESIEAWKFYRTELEDCLERLRGGDRRVVEDAALRLTLMAMGPDELGEIRMAVYRTLVLDVLKSRPASRNELAVAVGNALHLSRSPRLSTLEPAITSMLREGFIEEVSSRLELTDKGKAEALNSERKGAKHLLQGKDKVKKHLEDLLARSIDDDLYADIWSAIEDRLGALLYERGAFIVSSAAAFVEKSGASEGEHVDLFELIDQMASAAAARWPDPEYRPAVSTAVRDLFLDGEGPAQEWLLRACGAFLSVCALGYESLSVSSVKRALLDCELVLDSDVLLSLVCRGEQEHKSVSMAFREWKALGGRLASANSVVAEVAHHAWIAQFDYNEIRDMLPGTFEDCLRLVRNAFVRSFAALLREKRAKPHQWFRFIDQWRGKSASDVGKASQMIRLELGLSMLEEVRVRDEPIAKQYLASRKEELRTLGDGRARKIQEDKLRRDAELLAAIAKRRSDLERVRGGGTCTLVSNSERLRRFERLSEADGSSPWVIPPASWIYMLSCCPGVSVGLPAMKALLFGGNLRDSVDQFDELVLRAMKGSGEYSMGWAERPMLRKGIQDAVLKHAKQFSVPRERITRAFENAHRSDEDRAIATSVLADAIREIALESATEKRLRPVARDHRKVRRRV